MAIQPLLASSLFRYMRHGLGDATLSSELFELEVANDAGEWFYDAYDWRWKSRPPYRLAIAAGATSIALPDDFGEIIKLVNVAGGGTYVLGLTTIESLARHRAVYNTASDGGHYAALVYSSASDTAPMLPHLEICPPRLTALASAADLFYRARWVPLTDGNSVVRVPSYCYGLIKQVARAFASGLEDEDVEALEDRLVRIKNGPMWSAAEMRDQGEQNEYGPMDDGLAASGDALRDPSSANATFELPV